MSKLDPTDHDVDDLLRGAMKTLDDEVPPGYFEALPNRTLARLEATMQQGTSTSSESETSGSTGVPPGRDDDSGLHDIRNLASSQRMRLSSRRIGTTPPPIDDPLSSTSGSWKAVALPEPAKMVSLPSITTPVAELPPIAGVKGARESKKDLKRQSKRNIAAPASEMPESLPSESFNDIIPISSAKPASESQRLIGSRIAVPKKSKAPFLAVAGIGLAAAAGAAIYVTTQNNATEKAPTIAAATASGAIEKAPAPAPAKTATATPIEVAPPPAQPAPPPTEVAAAEPAHEEQAAADETPEKSTRTASRSKSKKGADKQIVAEAEKPVAPKKADKAPPVNAVVKGGAGKDDEPSFDDLLKEAGVKDKKEAAPKLEKKSLTGADIKKGMGGVASKAQGCFKGTQGTAQVKLTVDPSGKVTKVAVTGLFAGTPTGACVESAVKNATFPAWDGGPQSFGYSYLLSE